MNTIIKTKSKKEIISFLFTKFNMRKTFPSFFLLFSLFTIKSVAQVGTFVGTGMSVCSQFPFTICPGQVITPQDYGVQQYSCNGTYMPDVSFAVAPSGYRVAKHNWYFSANVSGQVAGYNSSGMFTALNFSSGDVITPSVYTTIGTNTFVTLSVGANQIQLSQTNFSISIDPVNFTSNSYVYCPNTTNTLSISPNSPPEGGPWNFTWQPGNLSGAPAVVSPTANTIYTLTATTNTGSCVSTTTVAVTVSCTVSECCIGNKCSDIIKNPLISNWEVPLGNNNYVFNKSQNNSGRVGIGVVNCAPGNLLEVNKGVVSNISGLRLTDLKTATPLAPNSNVLSINASGDVVLVKTAPSITNSCSVANFLPKTSTTGGNLTCSQLFDDGTSVGIGATGPFNYTSLSVTGVTSVPTTGTVKLFVNGVTKSSAYFATSDKRFKKQINNIDNAVELIKKIEGKSYYWRSEEFKDRGFNSIRQFGFIAQDLEKILPEAVATDEEGYKSVNYDMIIPILVQGIKEQIAKIEAQQEQIGVLKKTLDSLISIISSNNLKTNDIKNISSNNQVGIILNQNIPNPFSESTQITYNIPVDFKEAKISFMNVEGKIIKELGINQKGYGSLYIYLNDFSIGIYSYSLVIDGKVIDTKKMIRQ